jgi:hypothetical protein
MVTPQVFAIRLSTLNPVCVLRDWEMKIRSA